MSINLYIPVIMKLANALLLKVGFSNNFIYKMGSLGSVSVIHSEKTLIVFMVSSACMFINV